MEDQIGKKTDDSFIVAALSHPPLQPNCSLQQRPKVENESGGKANDSLPLSQVSHVQQMSMQNANGNKIENDCTKSEPSIPSFHSNFSDASMRNESGKNLENIFAVSERSHAHLIMDNESTDNTEYISTALMSSAFRRLSASWRTEELMMVVKEVSNLAPLGQSRIFDFIRRYWKHPRNEWPDGVDSDEFDLTVLNSNHTKAKSIALCSVFCDANVRRSIESTLEWPPPGVSSSGQVLQPAAAALFVWLHRRSLFHTQHIRFVRIRKRMRLDNDVFVLMFNKELTVEQKKIPVRVEWVPEPVACWKAQYGQHQAWDTRKKRARHKVCLLAAGKKLPLDGHDIQDAF